jgi:hypothetical protein
MTKFSDFADATAAQAADMLAGRRGSTNYEFSVETLVRTPPRQVYVLGMSAVASSKNNANTTEAALYTLALAAGLLGVNDALLVSGLVSYPNSATNKIFNVKLGATTFWTRTETTQAAFNFEVFIQNRNSLTSQVGGFNNAGNVYGSTGSSILTGTEDTSGALNLTVNAAWGSAGDGSSNITLERVIVTHLRAP